MASELANVANASDEGAGDGDDECERASNADEFGGTHVLGEGSAHDHYRQPDEIQKRVPRAEDATSEFWPGLFLIDRHV